MKLVAELSRLIPRGLLQEADLSGERDSAGKFTRVARGRLIGRFAQGFSLQQIHSMMKVKKLDSAEQDDIYDEILAEKDVVIKRALHYLKDDDVAALKQLIFYAKKFGHYYPEFKAIEKSMGVQEGSSQRAFSAGYGDDENIQFVNRRRGKKVVKSVIVKEEKLTFTAQELTLDSLRSQGDLVVLVMSDLDIGDYYGISVIFRRNGKIESSIGDAAAKAEWKKYKNEIIKTALDFLHIGNKEKLLKDILTDYKDDLIYLVKALINLSRKQGFDYPEFKAIEKSLKAK